MLHDSVLLCLENIFVHKRCAGLHTRTRLFLAVPESMQTRGRGQQALQLLSCLVLPFVFTASGTGTKHATETAK